MIEIRNLDIQRNNNTLLENLNVTFECGQFWGIVGRNGLGKTTLLHAITGLLPAPKNSIFVDQMPIEDIDIQARARKTSYLLQIQEPCLDFTVEQAIAMGQFAWQVKNRQAESVDSLMSQLKISHLKSRSLLQLSGGERRKVELATCLAQNSPHKDSSVDLVTVGQALHWFDFDAFFNEVSRVVKPNGVLAVWCYELHQITPEVDAVVMDYYQNIIGDFWPEERRHIENRYQDIDFPFEPIPSPKCTMQKQWTLKHLIGYLGTWSATQNYIEKYKTDPRAKIIDALTKAWGEDETKTVTWPVTIKTFRVNSEANHNHSED